MERSRAAEHGATDRAGGSMGEVEWSQQAGAKLCKQEWLCLFIQSVASSAVCPRFYDRLQLGFVQNSCACTVFNRSPHCTSDIFIDGLLVGSFFVSVA